MYELLNNVESKLKLIYQDGYDGDVELEYGFNGGKEKWELNLFHRDNEFLEEATRMIAETLNEKLSDTWIVNTDW